MCWGTRAQGDPENHVYVAGHGTTIASYITGMGSVAARAESSSLLRTSISCYQNKR